MCAAAVVLGPAPSPALASAATNTVTATVAVGNAPDAVAYDPALGAVYAACRTSP